MKPLIDPWDVREVKDYNKLMHDLGVDAFEQYAKRLKDAPLPIRRGLVLGHKDFSKILHAINNKQQFAILTGLMPSGNFHFGHMSVIQQVIYYQKFGAHIYLLSADLEAMLTRDISKEKTREITINEYLLNYLALGLSTRNLHFYFQTEGNAEYQNLSKLAAAKTTFNEVKAIYGDISPAKLVSALTQAADILKPQQDGIPLTLTPVGFDQLPHANFTRDLAARMNFQLPTFTFHKLVPGLQGTTTKMSSSKPESFIAFSDTEKEVTRKINKYAFSGGQATIEEHKKKGGNPDIDVSFQYLKYLFEENDKKLQEIKEDYQSGALLTGELKAILIGKINHFLKQHNQRKEKARKDVTKLLQE